MLKDGSQVQSKLAKSRCYRNTYVSLSPHDPLRGVSVISLKLMRLIGTEAGSRATLVILLSKSIFMQSPSFLLPFPLLFY